MKPNRTAMDESMVETRRDRGVEGLGLFDVAVRERDVRIDPPSRPGSASSERGAVAARPKAETQMQGILAVLAKLPEGHCLSRDEIIARTGLTVNAACGRLNTLVHTLNDVEAVDDGAVSHAGNRVTGYKLARGGRARIEVAS